jgi:CheY-like chemotaxis protein
LFRGAKEPIAERACYTRNCENHGFMSDLPDSLQRFFGALSHELRNPLAAISMAAETLSHLCDDSSDVKTMIDVIRRQSREANRLLEELADVSRLASGTIQIKKQRTNLVELIRRAVSERQPELDAGQLRLQLDLPSRPIWLQADPQRISQALASLIQNAIKCSNSDAEISVRASILDDKVAVTVTDHGAGIEPAALRDIFEPFKQANRSAHESGRGLGLGLALAKRLVELHGGSISAESAGLGKGATVRMEFPMNKEDITEAVAETSPSSSSRPLSILVIDDNPDMVQSLEFLLKAFGHSFAGACDGKQGVSAARQLRPDVIFCDISLPGMDGYAVARTLREDAATASIYLIAMSGFGSEEERRRSLDAGFDMHLNKPQGFVGLNDLLRTLPIGKR